MSHRLGGFWVKILSLQILPGANVFSYQPVIKVRLDIGDYEEVATNVLPEFNERLAILLPGIKEHHCSRGHPGGFLERLQEGTFLAHVFEHVVLELECQAGYMVNFGKARSTDKRAVYEIIVAYRVKAAGIQAVYAAEQLMQALIANNPYNLEDAIRMIKQAGEASLLGPSTDALYKAAKRRGIPVIRVDDEDLLILGYGKRQQKVWATVSGKTSALAADIASDKELTKRLLADGGVPVPEGVVVETVDEAIKALKLFDCPVAIKPVSGNQGKGVTLKVTTPAEAERAFQLAADYGDRVIVEQYIEGKQYRICVVNGKMAAAAERIPAYVIGDGFAYGQ